MTRLSGLKRFASCQVEQLKLEFPVFTWERVNDPVKLNAIFSQAEWKLDSPVSQLNEVSVAIPGRVDRRGRRLDESSFLQSGSITPEKPLQARQDWIHWFEGDPADENYVEIFFRRFKEGVALVWVRLRIKCRLLVLHDVFYKDYSAGEPQPMIRIASFLSNRGLT